MSKSITYLPIDMLIPHPQNPRKDLGDLTELADSIRENGIYQNMTVVPSADSDDTYTVIIGHRRLAAAKLAGLSTVPCVITDMTEKQQLETMLLENMQRADLTVVEEAQGLQLLIDLGEDVKTLSKSTGFSQRTIKNRLLLNSYDPVRVTKAFEKGATIEDYVRLSKIKDDKLRKSTAEYLGTPNFAYMLDKALKKEKWESEKQKIKDILIAAGAEEIETAPNYDARKNLFYVYSKADAEKAIEAADGRDIKFYLGYSSADYYNVWIMKTEEELRESESKPAYQPDPERERKTYLSDYVDRLNTDFDEYIAGFIRGYSGASRTWGERYKMINAMIYLMIECAIELGDDIEIDRDELSNVLRIDIDAVTDKPEDDAAADRSLRRDAAERIGEGIAKNPERYAMTMCWLSVSHDLSPARYYSWSAGRCAEYSDLIHLKRFISVLREIGFELPDELRAYLDGTHPIYTEEGCNKIYDQRDGSDE